MRTNNPSIKNADPRKNPLAVELSPVVGRFPGLLLLFPGLFGVVGFGSTGFIGDLLSIVAIMFVLLMTTL